MVGNLLSGLDLGRGRCLDHEDAVAEDGCDDEDGEQRMGEDVDGRPPDWVERGQEPHGVRGAEPENVLPFADHHERLQSINRNFSILSICFQQRKNSGQISLHIALH